jgi:hypothetical protein
MSDPLTRQQRETIRQRLVHYRKTHAHMNGFACCSAHASADDVPVLLAEIERLYKLLAAQCTGCYPNPHDHEEHCPYSRIPEENP